MVLFKSKAVLLVTPNMPCWQYSKKSVIFAFVFKLGKIEAKLCVNINVYQAIQNF